MSKIGMAAAIGAGVVGVGAFGLGAQIGALSDDENVSRGMAVGGVAGVGAGLAAIGVGALGLKVSGKIGGKIIDVLSSTATCTAEETAKGIGLTDVVGAVASGVTTVAGGLSAGFGTGSKLAMIGSPLERHATAIKGFGEKLVRWDTDADALHKVKFTKLGKGIIAGMGIVQGLSSAKDELIKSHMGQADPYVHTATPTIPAYQLNAGATGDLVFALNANRRG